MTPELTEAGYIQTKAKLADLLERRSRIAVRVDLSPTHRSECSLTCHNTVHNPNGTVTAARAGTVQKK